MGLKPINISCQEPLAMRLRLSCWLKKAAFRNCFMGLNRPVCANPFQMLTVLD